MGNDNKKMPSAMLLTTNPDRPLELKIQQSGYTMDEDGRYLIKGKWYTLKQAVTREKRARNFAQPFVEGNKMSRLKRKNEVTPKEALVELMQMRIEGVDITGMEGKFTVQEMILTKTIQMALNGSVTAVRELMDRMVGKPAPAVEKVTETAFEDKSLAELVRFMPKDDNKSDQATDQAIKEDDDEA